MWSDFSLIRLETQMRVSLVDTPTEILFISLLYLCTYNLWKWQDTIHICSPHWHYHSMLMIIQASDSTRTANLSAWLREKCNRWMNNRAIRHKRGSDRCHVNFEKVLWLGNINLSVCDLAVTSCFITSSQVETLLAGFFVGSIVNYMWILNSLLKFKIELSN